MGKATNLQSRTLKDSDVIKTRTAGVIIENSANMHVIVFRLPLWMVLCFRLVAASVYSAATALKITLLMKIRSSGSIRHIQYLITKDIFALSWDFKYSLLDRPKYSIMLESPVSV